MGDFFGPIFFFKQSFTVTLDESIKRKTKYVPAHFQRNVSLIIHCEPILLYIQGQPLGIDSK